MIKHIFIAFFISLSVCAQSDSEWKKLIKSAHNIGFCVYNTNQVFCDLHKSRYQELEKNYSNEDKEFFYVTMKEEWAKKRVVDWAKNQSIAKEYLILLFDINQGFENDYDDYRRARFGFFVINLKDDLQFEVLRIYDKQPIRCIVYHENEPNILCNSLWREFMSGRLGALEKKVEFLVYNKNKRKFNIFKKRFLKYQKKHD
ncbi:hypothetical protein [Lacinutrix jangbogonensis]|uniref:hypothetical protein n=1 Tax=Lacinutrix jangbogonensis TaxID=1469557 RepID=UPI000B23D40E|nr:hypothetical protein [Lacinutrix jangbogonensis]